MRFIGQLLAKDVFTSDMRCCRIKGITPLILLSLAYTIITTDALPLASVSALR